MSFSPHLEASLTMNLISRKQPPKGSRHQWASKLTSCQTNTFFFFFFFFLISVPFAFSPSIPTSWPSQFSRAVHLVLLSPPHSHTANQPWSPVSRGEAIYSNHRDPARAPQSPRGLIGNQRDGGYEGERERERNKLHLNIRFVEQTSPMPNMKQLCHEIVLMACRQDEGCLQGYEHRVEGLPVTEQVSVTGGHREGEVCRRSLGTGSGQ